MMHGTEARKLARSDAPPTSVAAAKSVNTQKMEMVVHEIISRFGENGCIHDQVRDLAAAEIDEVLYHSASARYSALIRKGHILIRGDTRKGRSGRSQRVMRSAFIPLCDKCQAPLVPGKALAQTFVGGMPDFEGDEHSSTFSAGGPGELVDCLKCPKCGKSISRN